MIGLLILVIILLIIHDHLQSENFQKLIDTLEELIKEKEED